MEEDNDLGITVANSLKPSSQCTKAAAKAMQVLGLIKRNFVLNDEEDFRLLFNGFVRPHLEYSPYLRKDIECLENVQRRSSKLEVCMIREFSWVPRESHGNGKHRLNTWEWKRECERWTGNGREMVVWKKFPLVA